nr:PilZ domain-containing protein [uncultured Cohaesibacter sp.]
MTAILERRQSRRRRVFKGAKLFYQNFMMSVDCTIRNESQNGMQLVVDPNIMLPDELSVLNRKEGTIAPVQMVWRHGRRLGIAVDGDVVDVRSSDKRSIRMLTSLIQG